MTEIEYCIEIIPFQENLVKTKLKNSLILVLFTVEQYLTYLIQWKTQVY